MPAPLAEFLGVKRITPHELRHSCTEIYVQAGAGAEDLGGAHLRLVTGNDV